MILRIINKKERHIVALFVVYWLFSVAAKHKSKDSECSVDEKDFKAEFVAVEKFNRVAVDEYGGDDG